MADVCVDLKVDRAKLNPNFEKYKVTLESIPVYTVELASKPECVELTDLQYSYLLVKSFGTCNAIYHDQWMNSKVYFIDENWKVMKFSVETESKLEKPIPVLQIPDVKECRSKSERVSPTLCFASTDLAIISNGCGKLYMVKTFDRKEPVMWKILDQMQPLEEGIPFRLLHCVSYDEDGRQAIDCLFTHVQNASESDKNQIKSQFKSVLEWLKFVSVTGKDGFSFELKRNRRLESAASPDYGALQCDGKAVMVGSEKKYSLVYDSEKPVKEPRKLGVEEGEGQSNKHHSAADSSEGRLLPIYLWHQTGEDVNVHFILPPEVTKSDIVFGVKSDRVDIGLKSGESLLAGELFRPVDPDESTWMVSNLEVKSDVGDFVKPDQLKLQVVLSKKDSSSWSEVVVGDDRGKCVADESKVGDFQEIMAACSGAVVEEAQKPAYNVQELEECDVYPEEENSVLLRIDGDSHEITHQVNLGNNHWLFNIQSDSSKPPCICLRHDVDGLVWEYDHQVEAGCSPWKHISTFDAFGYVQASKQQQLKFTSCAPNFSYAVIADSVRHLYLYWQPTAVSSPIRNRKTGQKVDTVAKQQLVSLETVEPITGLYAGNDKVFVVAGSTMHVLKVRQE